MPGPPGYNYNSYKRAVHNWGQENGRNIVYETTPSGPASHQVWSCMIYVDGIPGFTGLASAYSKSGAEEAAATQFWAHRDTYA
ncbi:hypothetical protein PC9H_003160 [Pleurotus ostreatus]|uniref:DRBM domain-containing protein n=1 Tax=Pleurotus ostreatus TaxID=5322 RepID=A0A8H7DW78_PLEOS|nr:uncharacterized protein PC9H_003160 [Pleurotus ostreatus]KAF7436328.1 hypothetical protein PC9H_003160 [Pleurotus ostreatus]